MGNANCCDTPAEKVAEFRQQVEEKGVLEASKQAATEAAEAAAASAEKVYEDAKSGKLMEDIKEGVASASEQVAGVLAEGSAAIAAAAEEIAPTMVIVLTEKGKDVTITVESRPLGLGFGAAPAPGCCGAPPDSKAVITSVDKKKDNLKEAKAGMFFKSINGQDVLKLEWTDFKALLKSEAEKLPEVKAE
mmetsp:Transcript_89538/g.158954  ORF Transcript_89538/g.158954 Transcript_89538/m.158954 type:complete len:190 (+) Transcript_89538:57-626(+)|eukprot:CAMPEP_0197632404 /NCGR_PEP_ID=MMETSP1338-20131121/9170_1 /TAXON_ID=43686 ORGANISM="Pelagodinium beii, Strain RCC1491" /NCGR_SAMPLE_ID=MMETSP1338 /ASSEMBLY_ACC=CAM_ASM_000754 /LENGTH=189 /DNA_ID=CAMNT_0043203967 /DNA_START=56 /DNA_END=625 /DNA_ORIENTATION=-